MKKQRIVPFLCAILNLQCEKGRKRTKKLSPLDKRDSL